MADLNRLRRHLFTGQLAVRRYFPEATLAAITEAVRVCESRHAGEIRFVIEAALPTAAVWRGLSPRERALEVFAEQRVWDTAHNNGVLLYVLIADRAVEIVADRGVGGGHVAQAEWPAVCALIEAHYRAGRFREGSVAGVAAIAEVLARHAPGLPDVGNEMPDRPLILR